MLNEERHAAGVAAATASDITYHSGPNKWPVRRSGDLNSVYFYFYFQFGFLHRVGGAPAGLSKPSLTPALASLDEPVISTSLERSFMETFLWSTETCRRCRGGPNTQEYNLTSDQRNAALAELLRGSNNGRLVKGDFSRVAEMFGFIVLEEY